jgi:hypothetical protein
MGLSFETTLLLALGLAVVYRYVFFKVIAVPPPVLGDGAVAEGRLGDSRPAARDAASQPLARAAPANASR